MIRRIRNLPWPWRIGLGVPLLLGAALAFGALISLISDGYERPETFEAGRISEFSTASPRLYEEEDIWVVRLSGQPSPASEGGFLALYDRGVESGCPLEWRREHEFMGGRGWFIDACTGSAYDLNGRCFSEPCRGRHLDRFAVYVRANEVVVDLRTALPEPASDPSAEPLNP